MSQLVMPFFDSDKAATKYAIQASGKKPKEIAAALWPGKTPDRAHADLLAALNDSRDAQLSTDEHIFIANKTNRFDWLYYTASKCNHSQPIPVTPVEQAAQLQAALFAKTDELSALLSKIEQLKPRLAAAA